MFRTLVFVATLFFIVATASAEPDPIPEADALDQAKKLVRELHKTDFAKKKASEQLVFARRLAADAESTKDPAARFVMLRESRELASRAGGLDLAMQVSSTTATLFKVVESDLRLECLETIEKWKSAPPKGVLDAALEVADDAVRDDNYKIADRAMKVASSAANRTGSAVTSNTVLARMKEVETIQKAHEALDSFRKTLAAKPDDPVANGKVGRFTCFIKGDWEAGLPLLAKSDNEVMGVVAALDLKSKMREERLVVADRWLDFVEKLEPQERSELRVHVYTAYLEAAEVTSGLEKTRLDKVLSELEKDPRIQRAKGSWTVIFRSSDPTIWNKKINQGREHFAIPVENVPGTIKYLKMSVGGRTTPVIIPMTKSSLDKQFEENGYGWNGKGNDRYFLGIYDRAWTDYPRGAVHVYRAADYYRGWGFGLVYATNNNEQGYAWGGVPVIKSVFEISVKSFALTAEETKFLLRKKK